MSDLTFRAAMLGRRATLDPGAFVKRGPDNEGNAYGESLDRWQRRAIEAGLLTFSEPETEHLLVCDQEHGHWSNSAKIYGHSNGRDCIRIHATFIWVYDPRWEMPTAREEHRAATLPPDVGEEMSEEEADAAADDWLESRGLKR